MHTSSSILKCIKQNTVLFRHSLFLLTYAAGDNFLYASGNICVGEGWLTGI